MEPTASTKKEALQGVFTRAASGYGAIRYFPPLGQWLVDVAQISSGARVLDVACGRGAVLFPTAEKVGPLGQVVGIDLSEGMVQATLADLHQRGLTQAQVHQMDAERLLFPDSAFDHVLCGFSLQFFPGLDRALSEFRRVLKPAGQVAVTTWGDEDSRWGWYDDLLVAYQAVVKLGSQTLDKREELFDWFSRAGFANTQIITKDIDTFYADEEEWWATKWSISGRASLEQLESNRLERLKAEVFGRMQALKEADGFHDRLQVHLTLAIKP